MILRHNDPDVYIISALFCTLYVSKDAEYMDVRANSGLWSTHRRNLVIYIALRFRVVAAVGWARVRRVSARRRGTALGAARRPRARRRRTGPIRVDLPPLPLHPRRRPPHSPPDIQDAR